MERGFVKWARRTGPGLGSGQGRPFPDSCRWDGAGAGGQGWLEATRKGLGLDAGEDVVMLCGGAVKRGGNRRAQVEVSVSLHDAWSRLICAGWLPQDHLFGWSGARSKDERGRPPLGFGCSIASGARCS